MKPPAGIVVDIVAMIVTVAEAPLVLGEEVMVISYGHSKMMLISLRKA